MSQRGRLVVGVFVGIVVLSAGVWAAPALVVGHVLSDDVSVDGIGVPRGTTVFTDSVISTDGSRAAVFVQGAGVISLDKETAVQIVGQADGQLNLNVKAGSVSSYTRRGGVRRLERSESLGYYMDESLDMSLDAVPRDTMGGLDVFGDDFDYAQDSQRWSERLGTVLASLDIPGVTFDDGGGGLFSHGDDESSGGPGSDDSSSKVTPDDEQDESDDE